MALVPAWTGFYAGLGGGGNVFNTDLSAKAAPGVNDPGPAGAAASLDGLGAAGGFRNSMAATITNSLLGGSSAVSSMSISMILAQRST